MAPKQVKTEGGVSRKRGRPPGKNRVPLSHGERRARNAQYERERRAEMADALADLAKAACCENSITKQDLLVTVITLLRRASRRKPGHDAGSLRCYNENLKAQIAALEQQLNIDPDVGSAMFLSAPRETNRHEIVCTPSPPVPFSSGEETLTEKQPCLDRVSLPERVITLDCHGLNSPNREFEPVADYCPPPGDQFWSEQGEIDLSSYKFADEQVPSPEYRIKSDSPEYIVPEPQHVLCLEDSPNRQESPSLSVVGGPHHYEPLLVAQAPTRHDMNTGMSAAQERNESVSPGDGSSTAELDPLIGFLSTEDLISMYLSS